MIEGACRAARRILAVRLGKSGDVPVTAPLGPVLTLAPRVSEASGGAVEAAP